MKRVMIAGGGTGGHIYPGLAIARAIQKIDPAVEVHFVGTAQGLETKIIPREGFPLHLIAGGKLNFSGQPLEKLKTLIKLPCGFLQSIYLLLRYRPQFVLGVGGYASGPFVLIAALMGCRTGIWEPNALPGLANRWLSRFVRVCYIVFDPAKNFLKNSNLLNFGMPVRQEIEKGMKSQRTDADFHLLVFGGSQGARAINQVVSSALEQSDWTQNLKVIHQVGALDKQTYLEKYQGKEKLVEMHEFLFDMPKYYAWADLIVARAGASTIAEVAAFGVPAIFIPLPVADGHQEKNAQSLVDKNAAKMILQKEISVQNLIKEIQALRSDEKQRQQLSQQLKQFFKPQAAEQIAGDIIRRAAL